jgi:hypothetical protein
MVARRTCTQVMPDGALCRAGPQLERPFCFAHDPERATEAAEARRLGGLRRRKEGTIAVAFDLPGLETGAGIRRLLDIVVTDGLSLENGGNRLRILIAAAGVAIKLLETEDLDRRIATLEALLARRESGDPFGSTG